MYVFAFVVYTHISFTSFKVFIQVAKFKNLFLHVFSLFWWNAKTDGNISVL